MEILNVLLTHGAHVNITNRWGYTPLQEAFKSNQDAVIELLQKNGAVIADINRYKKSEYFITSLKKAINLLSEKEGFHYGGAWTVSEKSLKPIESWFAETQHVNKFASFRQLVENTKLNVDADHLVCRVARSKKPEHLSDSSCSKDVDYDGNQISNEVEFKYSLSIPILYNEDVLAVIEFRSLESKTLSDESISDIWSTASRMVVGTIRLDEVSASTDLRGVFADQVNTVYELIVQERLFNESIVKKEVQWFYHGLGLNEFYFSHFPPQEIAKHVISFIAGKIQSQSSGTAENINFRSEDDKEALYIVPIEQAVEVERNIESRWLNEGYAGSSKLEQGTSVSVKCFVSSGTASPTSTQKLALYIVSTHRFVDPNVEEKETNIWKIATGRFLREKSFQARNRYQNAISQATKQIGPFIEISRPTQRDNTPRDGTVLTVVYKVGSTHSFFSSFSSYLNRKNINCTRKYIERFSNGYIGYSFHIRGIEKGLIPSLKEKSSLLWILPRTSLSRLIDENKLTIQETIYAYSGWKFAYHFLTRSTEEFNALWDSLAKDGNARARLLKLKKKIRNEVATEERIAETIFKHYSLVRELYNDFKGGFEPKEDGTTPVRPKFNEAFLNKIKRSDLTDVDVEVFKAFLNFNAHILKTNFFKSTKTAISYRLDPQFLKGSDVSVLPYAMFLVIGAEFRGFNIKFDAVARGGIRLIRSRDKQMFVRNSETLFDENYNLSYTQQKKNKDIPEGGSKGTILLSLDHQDKGRIAFSKYIDALIDILLPSPEVVDYLGDEELLFCGPDEGTADMMDWASLHAKSRGYSYFSSFTTGKSPTLGGIPHDTYGMTTNGVHRHVLGILRKLNLKEEDIFKAQTGGPDGDLGSNEIKISKDRTFAVVDGSGVLYDPEGIHREELTKLAKARKMVINFDMSKLSPKGFFVSVDDNNVTLPDGVLVESGMNFRNNFHLSDYFTGDLFVPCGGRPESVNISNVHHLIKSDGTPKFKYIVEGANLFFTQEARLKLEESGTISIKDSTANKGGVMSSSCEVLAALAMTPEEYKEHMCVSPTGEIPQFYKTYVEDTLHRIHETGDREFECIWRESERTKLPKCVISDEISEKINELNNEIKVSGLWKNNVELKKTLLSEVLPKSLINFLGLDTIIERLPESYIDATLSAHLASSYVYAQGISPNAFAFYKFMGKYSI